MYIKIGKTDIKYRSGVDDYMIFSEVPDSQLSYEKPILVRTKDELDIWFGRDFKDRNYFDELLKKGVTLYLYKPIKENNTHDIDDYIDLDSYYIFPEIFLDLPEVGEPGYAYYLKTINPPKHYYSFLLDDSDGRYKWFPVSDLSQYNLDPGIYESTYDLPPTGHSDTAYYVELIPPARHWFKYESGEWIGIESQEELNTLTPRRCLFARPESLPESGVFRYYTLSTKSWWIWKNEKWIETTENPDIQEFPTYFNTPSDLPETGDNYKYYVDSSWYIWLADSWTPENIFPQNLDNISGSLNNRDTLMISKPDNEENQEYYTPYSYPEFRLYEDNHLGVFTRDYELDYTGDSVANSSDLSDLELGYKTLAFRLSYTSEILDSGYIIIESQVENSTYKKGYNYCFYSVDDPSDLSAVYYRGSRTKVDTISELLGVYRDLGYKTLRTAEHEYLIYSGDIFDFTEFYTYKDISLENSFDDSENILTSYIQGNKGFEFYSKTIGTAYTSSENNIESLVSVKIEPTEYEKYRITIGRYDYTEIFEGPLFTEVGEERLDNIINNNSKLVMCDLSGLKNFIKSGKIYQGKIGNKIETSDFIGIPNLLLQHYYIPSIGQPGVKYKVCDGLWRTWDSDEEVYKDITRLSYNFYDLTEEILNYPDLETLSAEEGKSSRFKYYVESEDKFYTWDGRNWTILKKELLSSDEYSIKVERTGYEEYVLYIIAGKFSETYTGNVFKLQGIINESSEIFREFRFKDLCNQLRTGTYYLRRGKNESQTPDMYLKSLGCLFDTQIENIWPDYFLVPDISKYTNNLGETRNIERDVFLEHAKNFNCQFLIQNNNPAYTLEIVENIDNIPNPKIGVLYSYSNKAGTEYRISLDGQGTQEFTDRDIIEETLWGGDFIFNYTGDTSNYLVYFYRPLTIFGNSRPAYYVFLDGLLRNIYSYSETLINYDSPTGSDPYELDPNALCTNLETYKSNFMINNNHLFYYKQYFNGPDYYSTIWMRFVLGKIYRELQKNRWTYLSEKSTGIIETNIRNTLSKIQHRFRVVGFINLTKFTPKMSENYLELSIDTYVNDLMNNNMTLDITVNYNELNTD